jgi:hypothetical protein
VRSFLLPAIVLSTLIVLSGCGGEDRPDRGALEEEAACLENAGASVTVDEDQLDFVANTALGGAMKATVAGNVVTIAFGETQAGARRLERAYRRFAGEGVRRRLRKVLERRGTAVLLWTAPPVAGDRATVARCLQG